MIDINKEFGDADEEFFETLKHGFINNQSYRTVLKKNKVPKRFIDLLEAVGAFQYEPSRYADTRIGAYLQCSFAKAVALREEFIEWQNQNIKFYEVSQDTPGVYIYTPTEAFLKSVKAQQEISKKMVAEIEAR